ncbi:hypothetical protein [Rhodococcus globerulus]|uniref:hypothetical protein n=1 Tax=Rhodococcus globerulus TaxID=33008 RepID=UPI001F19E959|nr:hypothetical protein [Rhodococcus globerulus]
MVVGLVPSMPPVMMSDIFTDEQNENLFWILRNRGPWKLLVAQYFKNAAQLNATTGGKSADAGGALDLRPTFRGFFARNGVVYEEGAHDSFYSKKLLDSVKSLHGAEYAVPFLFQFNIAGPATADGSAHFDGRSWRGMDPMNTPPWLMSVMARSGLFERWEVQAGQVISYYYRSSIDGGFTYWPDGPDEAASHIAAPFWNNGLVTDNQHMFHRGESSGPLHRRNNLSGATMETVIEAESGGWAVKDADKTLDVYTEDEIRVLFHYDAHVFRDMDELRVYFDHKDDLKIDQVLEMLIADVRSRGVKIDDPSDPMNDPEFISALSNPYALQPSTKWPVD